MDIEKVFRWIAEHQDALNWLCGSGVLAALLTALYKLIRWLLTVRRERQRGVPESPFKVFPPGSNLLLEVMPDPRNTPLSDYNIPYVERVPGRSVRREMEDLLRERGALLVLGKSGIGKTREAVHLAQMLNNEGWTVLYLRPDAWLDAPSRPLPGVPARKLLLLLDNLNVHCYRARREVSPRADSLAMPLHEPFQKRLLRTLEALEVFYGRGEILVLATARNERVPEQEGEPAEWDKLEWERYPDLWGRFALYEVPEPDPEVATRLLETLGKAANVHVEGAKTIARRNDGTLRNLVENLDMAANPERGLPALTPETFRDTLRGTWAERYRRALARYPEAKYLYWAAALLRRYGFPLERRTVLPLARGLLPGWNPWVRWVRLPRALRDLERREVLYTPRDGQLEAAGPPEVDETAVVRSLIHLGERYRLADALHNLAVQLMWPEGARSAIHHPNAVCILQKVTAWQPRNPAAWHHLGVAYALATQYQQAIQAFQRSISLCEQAGNLPLQAASWHGLGDVYYTLGRYDEAIQAYWRAIDLSPQFAYTRNDLGNAYADISRYKETIRTYQSAIRLALKPAYLWNALGSAYFYLGRYEDAIKAYQQAITLDPQFADSWNGLGNVYANLGDYDKALYAYQQAIALAPKLAQPWNGLGNVYADLGDYDKALYAYQQAIVLEPQNALLWNNLGNLYRTLGYYNKAIQAYWKAIELDPKLAEPWNGLGNLYYNLKLYEEAITAYQRAILLAPNLAISWNGLGNAYANLGYRYYKDALSAYQRAIDLDPQYSSPWNGLGNVYYAMGRYNEAIASYKKALELPDIKGRPASVHTLAWNGLGNVYYAMGHYNEALDAYLKAIDLDPKLAYPWNGLGNVYYDLRRYNEAIQAYQQAIALDPKFAHPWNGLGIVYYDLGRYDEAIQAYKKAIALDPNLAAPWNGLGNVYWVMGRYNEALDAYQRAIALDPKLVYPWEGLGNVYYILDRTDEAIQAYQQAIALDPKDALPWNGLGNVYALRGEWEQALDAFRQAAERAPERGVYHASVASALRALGRDAEAQEEIARARPLMEKETEYNRARFAAICGEREEALRLLEIALQKRQVPREWARRDPDLRSLHGDPQFEALVGAG